MGNFCSHPASVPAWLSSRDQFPSEEAGTLLPSLCRCQFLTLHGQQSLLPRCCLPSPRRSVLGEITFPVNNQSNIHQLPPTCAGDLSPTLHGQVPPADGHS